VLAAYRRPTGLATALSEAPNLVILDADAAGMDGLDVCRAIRRDQRCRSSYFTARAFEEADT